MPDLLRYFDGLLQAFEQDQVGRFVHLGTWQSPPSTETLGSAGAFDSAQARLNEQLLELATLQDGQHVVDVGCGFGGTLQAIDARWQGMRLTGINIDPRQLEVCNGLRATGANTLHWLQADACRLPLPDHSVDRVLCIEAMFHFDSRRAFFEQAARVLRRGGVLVVSDILPWAAAHERSSPRLVEAALSVLDGFGPWPDFWSLDADHQALASRAGLMCTAHIDATCQTLPSHVFTAPANAPTGDNPVAKAAWALAMLHRGGWLRYPLLRFERL